MVPARKRPRQQEDLEVPPAVVVPRLPVPSRYCSVHWWVLLPKRIAVVSEQVEDPIRLAVARQELARQTQAFQEPLQDLGPALPAGWALPDSLVPGRVWLDWLVQLLALPDSLVPGWPQDLVE